MKASGIISSMPASVAPVARTEEAAEHLQNGHASRHGRDGLKVPHPIPYQGSKRNLAPAILGYFPQHIATLIEPFAGSAAITLAVAARGLAERYVIADLNQPLVELWRAIIESPEKLAR